MRIAVSDGKEAKLAELQLLMERWFQRAKNRMKTLENPFNLANGHIFVLMHLYRVGTCKVNDAARMLGITSGAATGLTDKLVTLGLVARTRQEEDRRVVKLSLTAQGKETVEQTWKQRREWFTSIVGRLDDSQIDIVLNAFTLLYRMLDDNQDQQNKEVER